MILPRDSGCHNPPPPLQPLTRRPLSISHTLALRYLTHRILHNRCIRIIEKHSRLNIQLHHQRTNLLHLSRLAGWTAQWILSHHLHLDLVSQWRSQSRCGRCRKARLWNHGSLIIIARMQVHQVWGVHRFLELVLRKSMIVFSCSNNTSTGGMTLGLFRDLPRRVNRPRNNLTYRTNRTCRIRLGIIIPHLMTIARAGSGNGNGSAKEKEKENSHLTHTTLSNSRPRHLIRGPCSIISSTCSVRFSLHRHHLGGGLDMAPHLYHHNQYRLVKLRAR